MAFLTILTDRILAGAAAVGAFIGGITVAPQLSRYFRNRKILPDRRLVPERKKRLSEILPCLVIRRGKFVNCRNEIYNRKK
jgi:hypothetical protein